MTAEVDTEGYYTFARPPKTIPRDRKKFKDFDTPQNTETNFYGNMMYDRRIIRGNTYAQHTLPAAAHPDPIEMQRQQEKQRRLLAKKRAQHQFKPRTPDAVDGRKHIDVQTELYLEELSDRVEEADVECQTDAFLDRPPTPLFIPAKTGKDTDTQTEEKYTFSFDIEVKPIIEVLVGKVVEQSLLEVMEEDELANIREQIRIFEEIRNAELVEQQRLEEKDRRHQQEKKRRMEQQREVLMKKRETADKISARAFAQNYLKELIPSVFDTLANNGYFYDVVEREVEQEFMPWLMEEVEKQVNNDVKGRIILDALIHECIKRLADQYPDQPIEEVEKVEPAEAEKVEPAEAEIDAVEESQEKEIEPPAPAEVTEPNEEDVEEDVDENS